MLGVCVNCVEEEKNGQFVKAELLGQKLEGLKRSNEEESSRPEDVEIFRL